MRAVAVEDPGTCDHANGELDIFPETLFFADGKRTISRQRSISQQVFSRHYGKRSYREIVRWRTISRQVLLAEHHETKRVNKCCISIKRADVFSISLVIT